MATLSRVSHKAVAGKNLVLWKIGAYYRIKRGLPAQTSRERKLFKEVFKSFAGKRLRVFEWGSGNSTIHYGQYLNSIGCDFEWHAIDNSREWKEFVTSTVNHHGLDDKVHIHFSEFPPFWEVSGWSWKTLQIPKEVCSQESIEYVEYPRRLSGTEGFDVIIIDGRFRRRCLIEATSVLARGGLVLLHDAQKTHYHNPLQNYKYGRFFDGGKLPGSNVSMKTWIGSNDPHPIIEQYTP